VQEQEQNRTEQATPFKLTEAKKKGQVAKSLDFNSLVVVCGLLMALSIWGEAQWRRLCELSASLFASAGSIEIAGLSALGREVAYLIAPVAFAGVAFGVIANVLQTGFIFSAHPLKPQFERLNPVAGFKRIFNKRMLFEALKSVLKLIFFTAVAWFFFTALWPKLPAAATHDAIAQTQWLGDNALALLLRLGLALVLVGLVDLLFTRWNYSRQMMMSRREVKEEVKRREGDPLIRQRIRELQRENLKQAQSMSRLPDADVLITNPTHFAVALRYVRDQMDAPVVLAKGTDNWAQEMKALARTHGVPIVERRKLARELCARGRIDQPIPLETFVEVARVYAELGRQRAADARYEVGA
jgi:flagellar biosynthesis protein FlhB